MAFAAGVALTAVSPATPLTWNEWPRRPRVALTFDDGPRPLPTLQLCEVLGTYRIPATFFVVGSVAAKYPELLQALTGQGHEIANHTWSHPNVRKLSAPQMRAELDRTREMIQAVTGRTTYLFRTPGGTASFLRHRFRVPLGYKLVLWNVHSLDQEGRSADEIAARVLDQVKDGDIVLMHNGLPATVQALELIVPTLQRRGFEFVTVTQLLNERAPLRLAARRSTAVRG